MQHVLIGEVFNGRPIKYSDALRQERERLDLLKVIFVIFSLFINFIILILNLTL
jgi:hypothetical protein